MHAAKSFPRHAPVQILDGCQGTCSQGLSSDVSYEEPRVHMEIACNPGLFRNPGVSGAVKSQNNISRSSNHQIYPCFHPSFNPLRNQENYTSYLQMSSTFSSLIVTAVLQNPAAHAAVSFGASLWPTPRNLPNSTPGNNGSFASQPMHPAPSMAAIAAATVAATTAWWAAHGLLPLSAPFHSGFSFPPTSVPATFGNVGQTSVTNEEKEDSKF